MAAGTGRSVFKIQNVRSNRKWCKTFLKIAIDIDFNLRMKTKEICKAFETLTVVTFDGKKQQYNHSSFRKYAHQFWDNNALEFMFG